MAHGRSTPAPPGTGHSAGSDAITPPRRSDGPAERAAREPLDGLLRSEAIACTPTSHRERLLGTYRDRAFIARRDGWQVPILHPREMATGGASLRAWADFYLPDEAPPSHTAILAVAAHIARQCDHNEIEIDPWDVMAWLGEVDERTRDEAQRGLRTAGFLPARDTVNVLSLVHPTEQELSLRLLVSQVGFGDRGRHFLLRYFLDAAQMPAAERSFAARGASTWIEGNRAILSTASGDSARALLAFNELVAAARQSVVESAGTMAIFCEMSPRMGMVADLDPWGDVELRHGMVLFEIR